MYTDYTLSMRRKWIPLNHYVKFHDHIVVLYRQKSSKSQVIHTKGKDIMDLAFPWLFYLAFFACINSRNAPTKQRL